MGFSQELIIKNGVTPKDIILLQYIMDAQASVSMYHKSAEDNSPSYVWLTQEKILEDLPMFDISKNRLTHIMGELKKKELIETVNEPNLKGSRTFYRVSAKTLEMTAKYKEVKQPVEPSKTDCSEPSKTDSSYNTINTISNDIDNLLDNTNVLSDLENREVTNTLETNTQEETKTNVFSKFNHVRELCIKEIKKYSADQNLQNCLVKFLDMRIEKWKQSPKATLTVQSFKSYLKKLDTMDYKIEVVNQSTRNEWNTFYEIKSTYGKPTKSYNENVSSEQYTQDEKKEIEKWRKDNNVPVF